MEQSEAVGQRDRERFGDAKTPSTAGALNTPKPPSSGTQRGGVAPRGEHREVVERRDRGGDARPLRRCTADGRREDVEHHEGAEHREGVERREAVELRDREGAEHRQDAEHREGVGHREAAEQRDAAGRRDAAERTP